MKIVKQPPEASKPEKAWIKNNHLYFNIHAYSKDEAYRIDQQEMFELEWIKKAVLKFGPRKGFKELLVDLGNLKQGWNFKISKSHKKLASDIAVLLSQNGILVKKEIGK